MDLKTTTAKLDISASMTIYVVHAGNHIDITVGRHKNPVANQDDGFTTNGEDAIRALLEVVCKTTREYLEKGGAMEDVLTIWRGTRFEPSGYCPQLEGLVSSPLDAAARWIEKQGADELS